MVDYERSFRNWLLSLYPWFSQQFVTSGDRLTSDIYSQSYLLCALASGAPSSRCYGPNTQHNVLSIDVKLVIVLVLALTQLKPCKIAGLAISLI
jgi:hypothetical protein